MQLLIDDEEWHAEIHAELINTYSDPNGHGSFMSESYSSNESQSDFDKSLPSINNNNDDASKGIDKSINKSLSRSKSSTTSLERMQPQASNAVMQCLRDDQW